MKNGDFSRKVGRLGRWIVCVKSVIYAIGLVISSQ